MRLMSVIFPLILQIRKLIHIEIRTCPGEFVDEFVTSNLPNDFMSLTVCIYIP